MPQAKTTRLEAVNTILRAVNEAPVASLSTQGSMETQMAEAELDKTDREVQTMGWSWNRRTVTYTRTTANEILIPGNVIRVDGALGTRYSVRDGKLFDLKEDTSVFTTDVKLEITELLAWDDIPEAVRSYILIKAARRHADQSLGDPGLSSYTRQDEQEAMALMRKHELHVSNPRVWGRDIENYIDRQKTTDWVI